VGRSLLGSAADAGGVLLLPEFRREPAVLEFEREHALLKVGHDGVEAFGELLAEGDALFQLLTVTGVVVFVGHVFSVAHGARNGEGLLFRAAFMIA